MIRHLCHSDVTTTKSYYGDQNPKRRRGTSRVSKSYDFQQHTRSEYMHLALLKYKALTSRGLCGGDSGGGGDDDDRDDDDDDDYNKEELESVLRQVHSLFRSGLNRECNLVLSLIKFHYSPLSRSSGSYVLLLPRLHVPSTFPSITYCTRVGTLIVATIYLRLIQNRYMFRI